MQPTNNSERKRKFRRFGIYYTLSVAAICVLVFAFADGMSGKEQSAVSASLPATGSAEMALAADSLLHRRFSALENSDNQYTMALGGLKKRDGLRIADSLRRLQAVVEQNFQFTLDSISRLSRLGANPALKQTVDYFAAALALRSGRSTLPTDPAAAPALTQASADMPVRELLKNNPELKGEMLKKDIRIADLEALVNDLKKNGPGKNEIKEDKTKASTRQLEEAYETLQKNYKTLAETNTRLRNASSQPATAPAAAESDAVKSAKTSALKMEQQLQEMNADLSFSTVDCNLSRADVNQIIYNGKQRKILLQQALDILTNLKKSTDEEVQKRAMQKISQLNRIAMTVRD